MIGIEKDIDCLMHILLAALAQGKGFYDTQKEEIKSYFGEDNLNHAETMLKGTRIYAILMDS